MRTICISHSVDLDGWMSAAVVKHWFTKTQGRGDLIKAINKDNSFYKFTDNGPISIDFLGWNYGDPIPNLSEYDKVIMCDISFPKKEMLKLWETKGVNFYWIDHHISAIKEMENAHENISSGVYHIQGLRNTKYAACELTWIFYFPQEKMPEIVKLLGMYDSFRHKQTDEEQTVLEFQYGARAYISNYEDAYVYLSESIRIKQDDIIVDEILSKGKAIYKYLCTEAKRTYKNGFEIKFLDPLTFGKNPKEEIYDQPIYRKFICFNKERFNPINFGIDYHADGYDGAACFHYANGYWNFSLYNHNGEVDCSVIAKQYGGGGHKGAAGFQTDDIKSFLPQK